MDGTQAARGGGLAGRDRVRDWLAVMVFIVAAAGILVLAAATLLWGSVDDKRQVFPTLVALFGTWVGTILAFYFSRENFQAANDSLQRTVDRLTPDDRLRSTPVRIAMIPRSSIEGVGTGGEPDDRIPLSAICGLLAKKPRIPLIEPDGSLRYIVHDSMVWKYLADLAIAGQPKKPADLTVAEMLAHRLDGETIGAMVKKVAYVAADRSLAEARDAMLAVKGAKDVIVTRTGRSGEPVEGWVTDVDIARHAQVQ
ncbi:hypothetical protein [Propylenella binzhouense]|uniref:CBS domain-containing protein n=1 Tax=Propylenella binzhouense TaxID=2555902 RepID=A0A964WUT5_9HYPH|nr:hypothetical protein [Propylenella binzhouense]MYZ49416.1 hypothetical protein [Propylenella binzhouense]